MAVVAIGEISQYSVPTIPHLINLLKEKHDQMLMAASLSLVRIGSPSIEPLQAFVESEPEEYCFWASWALALLDCPLSQKSIAVLSKVVTSSKNPIETLAAQEALGKAIGRELN
jgi:hypothetical protein